MGQARQEPLFAGKTAAAAGIKLAASAAAWGWSATGNATSGIPAAGNAAAATTSTAAPWDSTGCRPGGARAAARAAIAARLPHRQRSQNVSQVARVDKRHAGLRHARYHRCQLPAR